MDPNFALIPSGLLSSPRFFVRQKRELAELIGFETRNKYSISTEQGEVAFAAEQQKGFLGLLMRQFLGHWRTFEIVFFGVDRQPLFRALHPFRFFFQRIEVYTPDGRLVGALQQRWSFFMKRFDVQDALGNLSLEMRSGFFRFWTFPFLRGEKQVGSIEKKWTGLLNEAFTDKDTFLVQMTPDLKPDERILMLAAAIFVDLQYFERQAR